MPSRWARSTVITLACAAVVAIAYAVLAYDRRWISDDGLIAVRTVRQLLAGNGPTFNAFERAEADTSTLWTYAMAAAALVTPFEVSQIAVGLGGILAVLGVVIAMVGTRRWHRARGSTAALVPFGVLVVIGVFPFWDFATSGLETGLGTCWLACAWLLLVRVRAQPSWPAQLVGAFVLGLGPLVRPEFALVSVAMFAAQVVVAWPLRRRAVAVLAAVGAALPAAYEVFRAGYYGALVPLPGLAKASASEAAWRRGFAYLRDFNHPYLLFVPVGLAIGLAITRRHALRSLARGDRVVLAAPVIAAALLLVFVARVGGDFMHARMCLPPVFLAMMPAALVPWQQMSRWFAIAMAAWAIAVGVWRGDGKRHTIAHMVEDERSGYATWTDDEHPDEAAYLRAENSLREDIDREIAGGRRRMLSEGGTNVAMNPAVSAPMVVAVGRLGAGSLVTPLDAIVADTFGLANPVGARITATQPGIPGHEKKLPWAWVFADFADPSADAGSDAAATAAARHALGCGELRELLASVREPLTAARFWDNLTGALARTRLVVPADPFDAEAAFCGAGSGE